MLNKMTKEQIIKACRDLEEALCKELDVSQMELECKSAKAKTHKATQICRDALKDINFY